jgi:hypothetical protein
MVQGEATSSDWDGFSLDVSSSGRFTVALYTTSDVCPDVCVGLQAPTGFVGETCYYAGSPACRELDAEVRAGRHYLYVRQYRTQGSRSGGYFMDLQIP